MTGPSNGLEAPGSKMLVLILEKTTLSKERNKDRITRYCKYAKTLLHAILGTHIWLNLYVCVSTSMTEDRVDKEAFGHVPKGTGSSQRTYHMHLAASGSIEDSCYLKLRHTKSYLCWMSLTRPMDPWLRGLWGIWKWKVAAGFCFMYLGKITRKRYQARQNNKVHSWITRWYTTCNTAWPWKSNLGQQGNEERTDTQIHIQKSWGWGGWTHSAEEEQNMQQPRISEHLLVMSREGGIS